MKQYELRWADLPAPIGRRPVLLLTRTPAYAYLSEVIVCAITSTIRGIPQEVAVGRAEGLGRTSAPNFDNVHAWRRQRSVSASAPWRRSVSER